MNVGILGLSILWAIAILQPLDAAAICLAANGPLSPVKDLTAEVSIADPGLNAAIRDTLQKPDGPLTQGDILALTNLAAHSRGIASLEGLGAARNLETLLLADNNLAGSSFSSDLAPLSHLSALDLSGNPLGAFAVPSGLTNLTKLNIERGLLSVIQLPERLTRLTELRLGSNQFTQFTLPAGMTNLTSLSLYLNQLTNIILPPTLNRLAELNLDGNYFSQVALPPGLTTLSNLMLGGNQLQSLTVPPDMTNLVILRVNDNQLTNLALPPGLGRLSLIFALGNQLQNVSLPAGLTNLAAVYLTANRLTSFTLPRETTNVSVLLLDRNPLTTLVLPQPVAIAAASFIELLRDRGVSIFAYPPTPFLFRSTALGGTFAYDLAGPPGIYTTMRSTDLTVWNALATVTNVLGTLHLADVITNLAGFTFYSAILQDPPASGQFRP